MRNISQAVLKTLSHQLRQATTHSNFAEALYISEMQGTLLPGRQFFAQQVSRF